MAVIKGLCLHVHAFNLTLPVCFHPGAKNSHVFFLFYSG